MPYTSQKKTELPISALQMPSRNKGMSYETVLFQSTEGAKYGEIVNIH